jgi:DsbC/DsbD-like thiol-disulfide interchange protein
VLCAPRLAALALAALAWACTREPSPVEAKPQTAAPAPAPERPALVDVELRLVGDEARAELAARLGPDNPIAGADALLAVHHRIEDGWHIYWQNPGDSGLRTRIEVDARQLQAGEVLYPAPDRFESVGQVTYGWGHEAVLFVPLFDRRDGAALELRSNYLACAESCIPGDAQVSATLDELPIDEAREGVTAQMLARVPEPAGDRIAGGWLDGALKIVAQADGLELAELYPYATKFALLGKQAHEDGALVLHYRFTQTPEDGAQGILRATLDGQPRWLELDVPWPRS